MLKHKIFYQAQTIRPIYIYILSQVSGREHQTNKLFDLALNALPLCYPQERVGSQSFTRYYFLEGAVNSATVQSPKILTGEDAFQKSNTFFTTGVD